ncbi:MAG: hypothetical protein ABI689_15965 [Thermoanaerobaculia bacterium]
MSLLVAAGLPGEELHSGPSAGGLTIDPNPAICFLELDFHGDLGSSRYSFLGDGRVSIDEYLNSGDAEPAESWKGQLSAAELQTLVSDLVESGLFAFDPEAQLERERKAGIGRSMVTDGGWSEVGVSLVRRSPTGQGPAEAVAHRFAFSAELPYGRRFWRASPGGPPVIPVVPEIEAYHRITAFATEVRQRATQIPKPRPIYSHAFAEGERPVLVLSWRRPDNGYGLSLTLYTTGRAVVNSPQLKRSGVVQVPGDQLERVLRDFDEGQLAHYDERSLALERRRLAGQAGEGDPSSAGQPFFTGSFRLRVRESSGLAPEPVDFEMTVVAPSDLAQRFPSIPAYKALADLEQFLFEMESFAQNSR